MWTRKNCALFKLESHDFETLDRTEHVATCCKVLQSNNADTDADAADAVAKSQLNNKNKIETCDGQNKTSCQTQSASLALSCAVS